MDANHVFAYGLAFPSTVVGCLWCGRRGPRVLRTFVLVSRPHSFPTIEFFPGSEVPPVSDNDDWTGPLCKSPWGSSCLYNGESCRSCVSCPYENLWYKRGVRSILCLTRGTLVFYELRVGQISWTRRRIFDHGGVQTVRVIPFPRVTRGPDGTARKHLTGARGTTEPDRRSRTDRVVATVTAGSETRLSS